MFQVLFIPELEVPWPLKLIKVCRLARYYYTIHKVQQEMGDESLV